MFSVFVFRRYGLSVPLTLLAVGFLLEMLVDQRQGSGYYSSHFWTIGLSLLVTGIIVAVISCVVNPPGSSMSNATTTSNGYSSLLVDLGDKAEEVGSNVRNGLQHFLEDTSDEDMFCYVPLNRCALALVGVGIILMFMDLFAS